VGAIMGVGQGRSEAPVLVEEILRTKGHTVETVGPDTQVSEVCDRMRVHTIGALVVTTDGHHVDGIVSERDVVLGIAHEGADVLRKPARHVMSARVITCEPGDHLTKVMAVITSRRIRHLPVVSGGRLVGIISIGDVLKARLTEMELEAAVLRDVYLAGH
jgi:CBS domain-containing protein